MRTDKPPENTAAESNHTAPTSCKFLGTDQDAGVCYSYANRLNHCYRKEDPFPVALSHQDEYCLSPKHVNCALFEAEGKIRKIPRVIVGEYSVQKKRGNFWSYTLFSIAIIVIGMIFSLAFLNQYGYLDFAFSSPATEEPGLPPPAPTSEIVPTKSEEELNLIFLYPQPTVSPSTDQLPTPSISPPYPTPGPVFGVPFGRTNTYVLHQAAQSESFHYLANLYNTTVEAIQALNNLYQDRPLILNQVIVIKPGEKEAGNLPRFSLIQLQGDTPLEMIAEHYGLSEESLSDLNDLGEFTLIPAGRWLLIPIEE